MGSGFDAAWMERRQGPRFAELVFTPHERTERATSGGAPSHTRATLWADNPEVAFSIPLLFGHAGIAVTLVDTAEACLRAAREGGAGHVLIIDCVTAVDAWERCAGILTQTSVLVLICCSSEEFVSGLKPLARGPVEWLPAAPGAHQAEDSALDLSALTPRERAVFALVVAGRSNAEIADGLGVAENTVKSHMSAIMTKLELHTRHDLIIAGRRAGEY